MTIFWPAVGVSIIANMILGFVWYGPLFGKAWAKELGLDMSKKPPAKEMYRSMGLMLIGTFLLAYCLAYNVEAWRIVMGVAMTACYIALHGLVAAITHAGNAGRRFGALEGSTKWGAVAAGLVAGIAATHWGLHAAFLIGAATLGVTTIPLFFLMSRSSRGAFKQPARTTDGPCSQPPTDLGGVHVNSRIAS